MVYSDFDRPSDNMNLSVQELNRMVRKQNEELYRAEEEQVQREQAAIDREREEYYARMTAYENEGYNETLSRTEFLENLKSSFLAECMMRLYTKASIHPLTRKDKVVVRNMINGFINENGAGNLITDFATKNLLLSEISRITMKYYNRVLNEDAGCNGEPCGPYPSEVKELNLDTTITDDFYKEIEDLDVSDASKLIKDRVADAISDFIDMNMASKADYEEVIQTAQDKISAAKTEAMIEMYTEAAQNEINEMKLTRDKNVFHCMVESLSKAAFKDNDLKARYIHEGTVDMDGIVNSTELIYTMLEMVNTTNMVNVDEAFITRYLESISK
jgi:hypothetical protein